MLLSCQVNFDEMKNFDQFLFGSFTFENMEERIAYNIK